VDDVTYSHNGANGEESKTTSSPISAHSKVCCLENCVQLTPLRSSKSNKYCTICDHSGERPVSAIHFKPIWVWSIFIFPCQLHIRTAGLWLFVNWLSKKFRNSEKNRASTSVFGTDLYPHMPILRPQAVINDASLAWRLRRRISTVMFTCGERGPRAGRFVRFRASREAKFPKMGEFLPWTLINRRAKYDAAYSFILGREICKRTNTQNYKQ